MRRSSSGIWIVVCGLVASGCGGVSDFEGLWAARSESGTSSCAGEYEFEDPDFTIRLREGADADLEYVSLDPMDLSKETCVQEFSVDGDVAEIEAGQDCTYEYEGVDDAGQPVTITDHLSFSRDRLELDGDSLRETGESLRVSSDGAECTVEFEIDFRRVDDA
ncbi:MAG TPA: hypothetical protein VGK73_00925 [Polyangiaceae bacterium]